MQKQKSGHLWFHICWWRWTVELEIKIEKQATNRGEMTRNPEYKYERIWQGSNKHE